MDKLLKAALAYSRELKYSVIPLHSIINGKCTCSKGENCTSPGKHPRNKNGLTGASKDIEQVSQWWTTWPNANIGIATGAISGFIAIDIDPRHDGDAGLESLELELGKLPDNVIQLTGGSGRHFILKHPGFLIESKTGIVSGVDVKADGDYIVAAPSNHISGKDYEWELSSRPDKNSPGEIPGAWLDLLLKGMTENGERKGPLHINNIILEGGRNVTLYKLASSFREKGLADSVIMDAIKGVNTIQCVPLLSDDEVETIVKSALKYEPGKIKVVEDKPMIHEYYKYEEGGKVKINTSFLAQYISKNENYIIVRKNGFDTDLIYYYQQGYYKRTSANEFKGKIKEFIPLAIMKPAMYEEVFKNLITDRSRVELENLDTDEKYINFKNGLYNVKTKILQKHDPLVMSTIQIHANYFPEADKPNIWLKYLEFLTTGDADLQNILQEWAGLTISNIPGYTPKKALVLYGPGGNNGKTQFIKILEHLIGTEFIATRDIQDLSKPFAGSDLYGKRALLIDDQKSSDFTDSSIFKSITGGGPIPCEFKGKQSFSYTFRGTVVFGCNELPFLRDEKGSHFFERLAIIPCMNVLTQEQRDPNILGAMKKEIEGIVLWALEGLERLMFNNYKLSDSKSSNNAVEEYQIKNDSFYRYVVENYIITDDKLARISKYDFEEGYSSWARSNDILHVIQKKNIKDRALKIGIKLAKISNNFYLGLQKKDDDNPFIDKSQVEGIEKYNIIPSEPIGFTTFKSHKG